MKFNLISFDKFIVRSLIAAAMFGAALTRVSAADIAAPPTIAVTATTQPAKAIVSRQALTDAKSVKAADFGARGDGTTDDTTSLQKALDSGKVVYLAPGKTYSVTSRLNIPSEGGLVSDGTATILARATGFINTDPTAKGKYGTTSNVISATGLTKPPFTSHKNIVIRGIKLRYEPTEGRYVDGIVARNVDTLTVDGLEISGFPVGTGIKVASISGNSSIVHNRIHDFQSNTDFFKTYPGSGPQITGIEVDDDRVNGAGTKGLVIADNEITNITVGPIFLAAHGYQTDGINVASQNAIGLRIERNRIRNTGEGIDMFGSEGNITDNVVSDAYVFGIKLIHGASGNSVSRNEITRVGRAGIVLAGSTTAAQGTERNTVSNNKISEIDPNGAWAKGETSCIQISDNGGTIHKARNNVISGNVLDPGKNGQWSINVTKNSGENNAISENKFVKNGSRGRISKEAVPALR